MNNWIAYFLHHETWYGRSKLRALRLSAPDRMLLNLKFQDLEELAERRKQMEAAMQEVYDQWPEGQWVDEVRGIGMVTAVSVLAHIGPIQRFPTAEDLISCDGLPTSCLLR